MSTDKKYTVRNWQQFQHYRDRNPPWIKLHYELLSSRDWVMLDDASRVLAIACMLIASRNEGFVPDDPAYVKRVAYLSKPPNFKPLIDSGFLCLASTCKQMLATARPETETERETEGDIRACEVVKKSEKQPHGEFGKVTLTDDEFNKLQTAYGPLLNQAIEMLDAYMAGKGKKYASCYAVMKRDGWVWEKSHTANQPRNAFGRPVDPSEFAPDLGKEERERNEYNRKRLETMERMRPGTLAVKPC